MIWASLTLIAVLGVVLGEVGHVETDDSLTLTSSRLNIHVNKTLGAMTGLEFDSIDILGPTDGRAGMGYFDCFCIPSVSSEPPTPENPNPASSRHYYVGQSTRAEYEVLEGEGWVGLVMSESYAPTGQFFQQWWFLRDGETGYHSFVRMQYVNESEENIGNLQEFRQVITPNSDMWTELITNSHQYGSLPSQSAIDNQVQVQDATWYYNVSEGNPYKQESSDYFTKYQWADLYGDHKAHGFYADGTRSNGTTLGFWTVFSNLEGYTGGPLRSDLVVDTNLYNYYASNHRGSATINITTGFDRIFGPSYVYLNRDGDLQTLLADAEAYANSSFAADFYDEVAAHIPGYTPTSGRGEFHALVDLPEGAGVAKAVLSMNGADMQDNTDYSVGQYWANVTDGRVHIPRVKAGTYRLTLYAEGVFGQYEQDDVVVQAGDGQGPPFQVNWTPESHGAELWRLGSPDKTAGEFRHGFEPDPNHTLHQDQYRQYWGAYDFPTEFPNGVNYTIGVSDPAKDWNYVHYSRYGGTYDRPDFVLDNVNVWTLNWTPDHPFDTKGKNATMTVQLAGARTPSGNLDVPEPSANTSDLDLTLSVNSNELVWTIPYYHSSSCSDRSGIACYNIRHHYSFPADWLKTEGTNVFQFILPYNASGGDTNFRNYSVSVMYDAIRLEVQ